MVTLTLSPVALGKVGTPHSRPTTGTVHGGAPTMYAAITHNSRNHHPSAGAARLAHGGHAGTEVLAYGSGYRAPHGSSAVRALQRRLASLGYQPGPVDGRYGLLTEAAVVRFQAAHGLTADGIAGIHTLAALAAAKPVLYPGEGYSPSGSDAVRSLQRHLAAAGFSPGPIDGRYGPSTERAVARFQHARHLRTDGIAGPQTIDQLQAVQSRPTHPRQHHVSPRGSAGQHQTRPAPVQPNGTPRPAPVQPSGAPRHAAPVPQRTRQPARHPATFPLVWVIVLVGLLLAVLASRLWRRRRGGHAAAGARPVQPDGRDRPQAATPPTETPADVSEKTSVPAGVAEAAGPGSAPEAAHRETDQHDGAAPFRLGLLLAQEGDRVGAEDAFRRADERGHADAAFELGVLLAQEGDTAGAKEAFRRADKRGNPEAAFNLGALLMQEGDRAGAEEAFRRAAEYGDGAAACNLGVLLEQRGELVGAKQAYQRADQLGHGVGAFNLGALLEEQGQLVAAKQAYRRADRRGDSDGAYHLGRLLEREGDRIAAKEAYRRADERGHPEGACNLGLLLKDEGDRAGAVGAFHRAGERGSPELVKVVQAALLELDPGEEDGR